MIEALVYIPGREYSAAATGDDFNLRFDGNESVVSRRIIEYMKEWSFKSFF